LERGGEPAPGRLRAPRSCDAQHGLRSRVLVLSRPRPAAAPAGGHPLRRPAADARGGPRPPVPPAAPPPRRAVTRPPPPPHPRAFPHCACHQQGRRGECAPRGAERLHRPRACRPRLSPRDRPRGDLWALRRPAARRLHPPLLPRLLTMSAPPFLI